MKIVNWLIIIACIFLFLGCAGTKGTGKSIETIIKYNIKCGGSARVYILPAVDLSSLSGDILQDLEADQTTDAKDLLKVPIALTP